MYTNFKHIIKKTIKKLLNNKYSLYFVALHKININRK